MKYKVTILFTSIIAIIFVLLFSTRTLSHDTEILGVKVYSGEKIEKAISGRVEKREVYHYPVLFNGNNLPYDWQTNTLYIPQNMEEDSFQGKLEAEYGELLFSDEIVRCYSKQPFTDEYTTGTEQIQGKYDSKISRNDYISENVQFSMYLVWDNCYIQYNVIFTGMPIISLTYDNYDPELMSWNGAMTLTDPYHKKNEFISGTCEYHLRGDSTSHLDKKSYEINLNEKQSLVGMRTDDDWALIALLGDNGFVHNKLAYDVWNDISDTNEIPYDNTVNSEFVEVFYDNTYAGLYLLCEKIDRKQCKLDDGDYLFRLDEMKSESETSPDYEKQYYYQIKWPKEYTEEDYSVINDFEQLFFSKEGIDYEKALNTVNIENITDINLYSMLICGVDNWDANCLYIAPKRDNYRICEVMWDMNETFGDDEWFNYRQEYETSPDMMIPYVKKIYDADKKYMSSIMYKRWKKLRSTVISEDSLTDKAKEMETYIAGSGAILRETNKWNQYMNLDWRYSNLYEFINNRINYLDKFWENEYTTYNQQ